MTSLPFAWVLILGTVLIWAGFLVWFYWGEWTRRPEAAFAEMPVQTVEAAGWTFRYHRSGRGPDLLLLHGLGANLYCWRWILPLLRTRFTVTAVDLPGFGGSSKPLDAHYGLDDQVPRLVEFLRALKVKRTFVVGNSMGGNIALWMALLRPELVDGVCVIAPASSPKLVPLSLIRWEWLSHPVSLMLNRRMMKWAHQRTVSRHDRVDDARIEETFKTYGRQKDAVRSFLFATEAIRDSRLPKVLSGIKTEVLVLWGSLDRLVPRKVIDALESALPAAETHVHIGGGHHLQEDEPDWVSEKIISTFLS